MTTNAAYLNNPGPAATPGSNDRRVGAPNHHHNSGSGENTIVGLTLDDTLHAVVQLTHEHGLPLTGANINAGDVQPYCALPDVACWVRWLTNADNARFVAWRTAEGVHLHVGGLRHGIGWAVVHTLRHVSDETLRAVLDRHACRPITESHDPLAADVMCALLLAETTAAGGER